MSVPDSAGMNIAAPFVLKRCLSLAPKMLPCPPLLVQNRRRQERGQGRVEPCHQLETQTYYPVIHVPILVQHHGIVFGLIGFPNPFIGLMREVAQEPINLGLPRAMDLWRECGGMEAGNN